jgi:PAS domain S-box-containing protein
MKAGDRIGRIQERLNVWQRLNDMFKLKIFTQSRIATRFLVLSLLTALVPLLFLMYFGGTITQKAMHKQALNELIVVVKNREQQFNTYFHEREKDVATLAQTPIVIEAMERYNEIINKHGTSGIDTPEYATVDKQLRHFLTYYKEALGFSDFFLIGPNGNAVFSVMCGEDLGSNYCTGPYRNSELAKVFDRAKTLLQTEISDFEYNPATNEPAAFIATPIFKENLIIGVIALQIKNEEIYTLVQDCTGLGQTGEIVVAAKKGNEVVFMSPVRHDQHAAFRRKITIGSDQASALQKAVLGKKGFGIAIDYRGKKVLAAWRYLPYLRWGLIAKIDMQELLLPSIKAVRTAAVISFFTIISIVATAVIASKAISCPIADLTRATQLMAGGDMTVRANVQRNDEIGQLAQSFNDMAEKRCQTENEQKKSELKFRTLYESSSDAVMLLDKKGFFDCNEATVKMFGTQDKAEFCSMHPADLSPSEQPCGAESMTLANERIKTAMKNGSNRFEWMYKRLDTDKPFLAEVLLNAMELDDRMVLQAVVRNINERKQAEKQLTEAKDEAEELNEHLELETARANDMAARAKYANSAKSQFLANMSHEIRTPMNAIVGFSDVLADENLTNEQKAHVHIIRESAENLLNLINDILDFSKIEAGQLNIEMVDCSLGKLLNSLEPMMKAQATVKSLDFKIVTNPDLPAQIHSDPYRLQQCLVNLVNNSIKFTAQGHVHLQVSLHEDNNLHLIRFDVEDTGIGIPKDRQQAIFTSFTQVEASTTRKYGGTGLGLTITKQLAGLLGGTLTLTSEPGKGSVFSLVIPTGVDIIGQSVLDRNKALNHRADKSENADTTMFSGNVLVAEDVEGNQKLMKVMLSKLGVDVVIAKDGHQAIEKTLSQSFDLVLMDMHMPRMNGYEATRFLKHQGVETPIVALTANVMKGDDQKCLEAGCDGYLTKPIDRRELPRILAKYLPARQEAESKKIASGSAQSHDTEQHASEPGCCPISSRESDRIGISDIINWDRLINRVGDEETIREIMPTCIKDIEAHFEKLSLALANGDCESIASHAHALKGVGRNLSIEQLSKMAGQIEEASGNNDLETSTLHFSSLKTEIDRVLTILSQCDWIERVKTIRVS